MFGRKAQIKNIYHRHKNLFKFLLVAGILTLLSFLAIMRLAAITSMGNSGFYW